MAVGSLARTTTTVFPLMLALADRLMATYEYQPGRLL
jgi:hypothetical protein